MTKANATIARPTKIKIDPIIGSPDLTGPKYPKIIRINPTISIILPKILNTLAPP